VGALAVHAEQAAVVGGQGGDGIEEDAEVRRRSLQPVRRLHHRPDARQGGAGGGDGVLGIFFPLGFVVFGVVALHGMRGAGRVDGLGQQVIVHAHPRLAPRHRRRHRTDAAGARSHPSTARAR
jgi:hypothetical protein